MRRAVVAQLSRTQAGERFAVARAHAHQDMSVVQAILPMLFGKLSCTVERFTTTLQASESLIALAFAPAPWPKPVAQQHRPARACAMPGSSRDPSAPSKPSRPTRGRQTSITPSSRGRGAAARGRGKAAAKPPKRIKIEDDLGGPDTKYQKLQVNVRPGEVLHCTPCGASSQALSSRGDHSPSRFGKVCSSVLVVCGFGARFRGSRVPFPRV